MSKKAILLASLAVILSLSTPGTRASSAIDSVFSSAVYLEQALTKTVTRNGKQYEIWLKDSANNRYEPLHDYRSGSGVLVVAGNKHPYLITAQHVARLMKKTAKAVIRGPNDTPITIPLGDLVSTDELNWVTHDVADVAALPISTLDQNIRRTLQQHFLPLDFLEGGLDCPSRDVELVTIGFPLRLGIEGKFSPISRSSKPASGLLVLPRFDTEQPTTFFLLEDPSVGGFSGAPVLRLPGTQLRGNALIMKGGVRCYGIVHGTKSDTTGGKFAAVTPPSFVVETINEAEKTWPHRGN